MSLGNLMAGALDLPSILQAISANGGNVIIVNAGGGGAPELPEIEEELPPLPGPPMGEPPADVPPGPLPIGPDVEAPVEEEPTDMMGAAKAALLKK
jgi:hypothetical protein